jgi:hypothetical protein
MEAAFETLPEKPGSIVNEPANAGWSTTHVLLLEPLKTTSSAEVGTASVFQFAAVAQLLLPPPPSQNIVAERHGQNRTSRASGIFSIALITVSLYIKFEIYCKAPG